MKVVTRVTGSEHAVRDVGLLVSAVERPKADVFGTEVYPTLHEKAAALLDSLARNYALVDGNRRTAWLCCIAFLAFNGARTAPPHVSIAGPFVEDVAQGHLEVATIAKHLSGWFPVQ
ncbi:MULTISPECIES: type II toxin-antitoxin system death-on-curing family toxin [unclassified Streptomyces]|uniref:type II toxin-antitoxin system death-on-curing family toxin n=1 Tax=unclassified Streptomyces TaxID=2593676 RepID=UPI00278C0FE1|nr:MULTISPECIES: Fic family protein [unclassified Streptomyces]